MLTLYLILVLKHSTHCSTSQEESTRRMRNSMLFVEWMKAARGSWKKVRSRLQIYTWVKESWGIFNCKIHAGICCSLGWWWRKILLNRCQHLWFLLISLYASLSFTANQNSNYKYHLIVVWSFKNYINYKKTDWLLLEIKFFTINHRWHKQKGKDLINKNRNLYPF